MSAWLRALLSLVVSHLPSVLTLAALVGLFFLGNATDWKLPSFASPRTADASTDEETSSAGPPLPLDEPALKFPEAVLPPLELVKLASGAAARAGLRLARVQERTMSQQVTAYGTLVYDQTRYAHLSTRAAGTVFRVDRQLGDHVRKGELLALIDAAEVGKAKAELMTSLVQVGLRTTTLEQMRSATGSVPERMLRDAEASLREARIKLSNDQQALANLGLPIRLEEVSNLSDERLAREVRFLGLPPSVIASLEPSTVTANLLPLRAPFDGLIIRRDIVSGEQAVVGQPQFVVADVRRLWVVLDVRREDARQLAVGQEVTFVPDGVKEETPSLPPLIADTLGQLAEPGPAGPFAAALAILLERGDSAAGRLTWISPEVDEKTRTVRVRAEVPNLQGRLRPNTFGNGRVQVRERPGALSVPSDAVQTDGPHALVFVQLSDREFQPRLVELGLRDEKGVEILFGVQAGELVVSTGSHVLKAELFKRRIAADD